MGGTFCIPIALLKGLWEFFSPAPLQPPFSCFEDFFFFPHYTGISEKNLVLYLIFNVYFHFAEIFIKHNS